MGYYIEVEPGVKIYVRDIGEGKPVIFIHGWPLQHAMWEYQFTQLPKYGYRCILVDLRGYGKSDAPWYGYDYNRMSDDVRVVMDTLHLEQVHLVGFSMGGAIAIRYMARHRGHKVCQLILAAAAAPSFVQRPGYPYGMPVDQVDELIRALTKDRPAALDNFGKNFFASEVTPAFRHWFNLVNLSASPHGTIAGSVALRDEVLAQDLPFIRTRTTIMHGLLDKICPFPFAALMHQGIPHSKLIRFDRSGHGIWYDELDLFNRNLLYELQL
ncbi:alpha/beta fold hydrolase [Paenibacillus sp. GCM10023252]|uniref:alpha/beta fold hydrolase n=1 Tax=Paenibacillus sp. GCM10023252 TaxID=3252649 RepID=UPI00361BADEA